MPQTAGANFGTTSWSVKEHLDVILLEYETAWQVCGKLELNQQQWQHKQL